MFTGDCWELRAHARVSELMLCFLLRKLIYCKFDALSGFDCFLDVPIAFVSAVVVTAVSAVLQGSVCSKTGLTEQGLWTIGNLADCNLENKRLLGAAGACEGTRIPVNYFFVEHSIHFSRVLSLL